MFNLVVKRCTPPGRIRSAPGRIRFRISLQWPIHIIKNAVDKTKLFCNTPHRRSTTVSLETFPPLHLLVFSLSPYKDTKIYLSKKEKIKVREISSHIGLMPKVVPPRPHGT